MTAIDSPAYLAARFISAPYAQNKCEVISMNQYDGLGEMLKNDPAAFDYYTSLPQYVRSMIARRSQNVHSMEELRNYADNLLRGDG